jgi:predicted O-methyltransferase YrrM
MNLEELYEKCKTDKESYKLVFNSKYKSGGEPYKYIEELKSFFEDDLSKKEDLKILEIGTGFGFTCGLIIYVLRNVKKLHIDTFEEREDHSKLAKENLEKFSRLNELDLSVINFKVSDFEEYFKESLKEYENNYDLILFDGYSPKASYLNIYIHILKKGGFLVSANSHLTRAEEEYFEKLDNTGEWSKLKEFGDTKIYIKQ